MDVQIISLQRIYPAGDTGTFDLMKKEKVK
jgi:hypothetical protein